MRNLLKKVNIFAGLDPRALDLLLAHAHRTRYQAKAIVVKEGEPGSNFYLIAAGRVRVCKRFGRKNAVELARLGEGEFFGEMGLLETLPRSATVQAVTAARVVVVASLAFYDLFRARPDQYSVLMLNVARDLSRRLRRLDEVYAARFH